MPNRTFLRYRAIKRNAATQKAAVYPEGLRMEAFLHVSAVYTAYRMTLPSRSRAQRTRRCFEATRESPSRQTILWLQHFDSYAHQNKQASSSA